MFKQKPGSGQKVSDVINEYYLSEVSFTPTNPMEFFM